MEPTHVPTQWFCSVLFRAALLPLRILPGLPGRHMAALEVKQGVAGLPPPAAAGCLP